MVHDSLNARAQAERVGSEAGHLFVANKQSETFPPPTIDFYKSLIKVI